MKINFFLILVGCFIIEHFPRFFFSFNNVEKPAFLLKLLVQMRQLCFCQFLGLRFAVMLGCMGYPYFRGWSSVVCIKYF